MHKVLREFDINFIQLENKLHHYEFDISPDFFATFPNSLIEEGKGKAFLELDKSETMMQLRFRVDLTIGLICDISLDPFDHQVKLEKEIMVKFGEEAVELSEDVLVIERGTASIDVSGFIYEFATLEIPMKKVHPRLREQARPELVYQDEDSANSAKEDQVDPRWDALKKLK